MCLRRVMTDDFLCPCDKNSSPLYALEVGWLHGPSRSTCQPSPLSRWTYDLRTGRELRQMEANEGMISLTVTWTRHDKLRRRVANFHAQSQKFCTTSSSCGFSILTQVETPLVLIRYQGAACIPVCGISFQSLFRASRNGPGSDAGRLCCLPELTLCWNLSLRCVHK